MSDDTSQPRPSFRLADGRLVYTDGRVVDPVVRVPTPPTVAQPVEAAIIPQGVTVVDGTTLRPATRRHLHEIPDTIRNANACALIAAYTLYGLIDDDIATALGTSVDLVEAIRDSETFDIIHRAMCQTVLDAETDQVRDVFRQHARTAAHVLVDTLHHGNRAERVTAARDFLDRAGHRPVDIVEHRHRMEGGLIIEVVTKSRANEAPIIEMEIGDDS